MNIFEIPQPEELKKFRATLLASVGLTNDFAEILNKTAMIWKKQFDESIEKHFGTINYADLQRWNEYLHNINGYRLGAGYIEPAAPSVKRKAIRGFAPDAD
jgi:hypothetical protein